MVIGTIPEHGCAKILSKLNILYKPERGQVILNQLTQILNRFLEDHAEQLNRNTKEWVTEEDVMFITYGDQFQKPGMDALRNLNLFAHRYLKDLFSSIHILPFYPYSSDDGFSVIDYFTVDPDLGHWKEIEELSKDFKLMFDAVINHISQESEWFQGYLAGETAYDDYFIEVEEGTDLSQVTRPRTLPLLTSFETRRGRRFVWTTFSPDQIDLNYGNEQVFLKIVELLLFYHKKGARYLRLDAIGYMWKEIGTCCIHLEETHLLIQLFRDIFDLVAPEMILITETNVPHVDNIRYFGDGYNEAQMVYQFPLPPLTLDAFYRENARYLSEWADSLEPRSDRTTFFNFLASHDGIGLMPAKGILTDREIQSMVDTVKARGGDVSYKTNPDGSVSPYELNISYFSALRNPEDSEEMNIRRFLCAHSILLSLAGVPGIYVHSLLGSENDLDGVRRTGRARTINREKFQIDSIVAELEDQNSVRWKIYSGLRNLIRLRKGNQAFHPLGEQKVLFLKEQVFALLRRSPDYRECVLSLQNISKQSLEVQVNMAELGIECRVYRDLLSDQEFSADEEDHLHIVIGPYQIIWLVPLDKKFVE